MNPEYGYLLRYLEKFAHIPAPEWQKMTGLFTPLHVDKNEYFIRQGDPPERLAIIVSGIFRVYCITESGDDKTLAFRTKGMALAAYTPFLENKRTWFSIQALEAGELVYILLDDFKKLTLGHPCWEKATKEYFIQLYIEKEEREKSFLTENAKTRYLRFKNKNPELEKRVHNFYVASYLGISPVSLSRIRGELKKSAN
jgi:CRP-like cAMP-binding protein